MDTSDAPPPYTPSEFSIVTSDSKYQLLLPQADEPGFASATTLSRGLDVPASTGFDYLDELIQYGISKDKWQEFTQTLRDESKLSRQQWTTVLGKGVGTLAIGGLMIGLFSAIPAVFVARNARKRQEQRNLVAALSGEQSESLSRHISHWNETFFRSRGVIIRVDLPDEYVADKYDALPGSRGREKDAFGARIVIIPLAEQGRQ